MVDFDTCVATQSGNIRTPKCRLSYVYFENPNPKAEVKFGTNKGKFKHTCTLLIPKTADIQLLRDQANAVGIEKFGEEGLKAKVGSGKFNTPFLDAFEISKTEKRPEGDEKMKDFIAIRTDSLQRPGILEANGQPIGDDFSGVYPGRWCFATLNASAYDSIDGGKPGVKFYLGNVQLLDHDERLGGGRPNAEDEFAPVNIEGVSSTDDVFNQNTGSVL